MDIQQNNPVRSWTFMVYLAGDNNLQDYAVKDLDEMKLAGSTVDVAIVTQIDRMSDSVTRRYELHSGTSLEDDVEAELPETNTGDPACLIDFTSWAVEYYPAHRYALVLWNHGSGWEEDDIYKAAERMGTQPRITRKVMRGIVSSKKRALFRSSLEWYVEDPERAIGYDDNSEGFLDNAELKKALEAVRLRTGRAVDLLGFDACLLNMLEVHYQVHQLASVITGSQEIEPGDGWPYNDILNTLVHQPDLTPDQLSTAIVNAYIDFYQQKFPDVAVTQSAIAVNRLAPVVAVVDLLKQELGPDMKDWKWDRLHRLTLGHVLGAQKPLNRVFDIAPFPIGGDANTVWAAVVTSQDSERRTMVGPPFRFIADLSDLDHCWGQLIPGQSGHLASRHYRDGVKPWFEGEYHPMLFKREEVEQNLEARLVLSPTNGSVPTIGSAPKADAA